MSTILYPSPVFGPVQSRRLGVSLGVNLMPADGKICSFDCLYCECGLNGERRTRTPRPTMATVVEGLERVLRERHAAGQPLDVITFAGNGEPTLHPDFPAIIDATIALRDTYFPQAKVSVLSNATALHNPRVHAALMRVDNNIQKLDTVSNEYIDLVDRPGAGYDVERVVEALASFEGHVIIQTMFMGGDLILEWVGNYDDGESRIEKRSVDNTSDAYVTPWLEALRRIRPAKVMIYTIDRETPVKGLLKTPAAVLDAIADRVREAGFDCSVSY